jgi:hypothetical protein
MHAHMCVCVCVKLSKNNNEDIEDQIFNIYVIKTLKFQCFFYLLFYPIYVWYKYDYMDIG